MSQNKYVYNHLHYFSARELESLNREFEFLLKQTAEHHLIPEIDSATFVENMLVDLWCEDVYADEELNCWFYEFHPDHVTADTLVVAQIPAIKLRVTTKIVDETIQRLPPSHLRNRTTAHVKILQI